MTVLTMSQEEIDRLEVITQVADRRLSQRQAADILGLGTRQVQRLVSNYRRDGAAGLLSRRRGAPSNRQYPRSLREHVVALLRTYYADFGPTLACEKLLEHHDITLSVSAVRQWMISEGLWVPRNQRPITIHQPRARRECFGELVQIDGSDHYWFEDRGPRCTLLVFIDDATGRLLHLRFVESESTFDYFTATRRYLEQYGRPVAFYSDKHSVFRVNKVGAIGGDGMTQFGRALHELNIDIICANTSQAKGRVERANKTLQDRLVKELRLREISTHADANAYAPEFIEAFNGRFAREPVKDKNTHRPLDPELELDEIFCWREERTVSSSLTVQYDKVLYLLDKTVAVAQELPRKRVTVYDYSDGTISIKYKGLALPYSIFDKASQVDQGQVVSNKRLGAVLAFAQERQQERPTARSKKGPARSAQRQFREERTRQDNPAV